MKTRLRVLVVTFFIALATLLVPTAHAANPSIVVVNWGDTLTKIAARNGTTIQALMRANGLPNPNFVYAGQRLIVPNAAPAPLPAANVSNASVYTVASGDMLYWIATRFGTTTDAIMRANGMRNPEFIYPGQRLNIPARTPVTAILPPAPAPPNAQLKLPVSKPLAPPPQLAATQASPREPPTNGKWIDIDIGDQKITAYEGTTPLKSVLVSTGLAWYPTPVGRYKVYMKIQSQTMRGGYGADRYVLPGVPWVMYFTGAYAIHGTYWHHNFGRPMSHGCVNLTTEDSKWFFDWAEMGTPVITHY